MISIHPMLRFISFCGNESGWNLAFQYIPCYGLSVVHQFLLSGTTNFNTSHVTVYHHFLKIKKFASCYFNTSHVTVYRSSALIYRKKVRNFNTSHVTVYQGLEVDMNLCPFISIHPMLRFILLLHFRNAGYA